jgi:hypothetical protein
MRAFFARSQNISFLMASGNASTGYIEVYDAVLSPLIPVTGAIVPGTTVQDDYIFNVDSIDTQLLVFSEKASLLYGDGITPVSVFEPPPVTSLMSIANYYTPVESPFHFEIGDIARFVSYFTYNPDIYTIVDVQPPVFINNGGVRTVSSRLKIRLDKRLNYSYIHPPATFAFLKKVPDETCIILNFNKPVGQASNALIIPKNLYIPIKDNIGNIIGPLKDTVLTKVLVIG